MPGTYQVDILLNGERVDAREISFSTEKDAQGHSHLQPCLSAEQLSRYGVKIDDYPDLAKKVSGAGDSATQDGDAAKQSGKAGECVRLEVNFNEQRLLLSIPQEALSPELRGIAPRSSEMTGYQRCCLTITPTLVRQHFPAGTSRVAMCSSIRGPIWVPGVCVTRLTGSGRVTNPANGKP